MIADLATEPAFNHGATELEPSHELDIYPDHLHVIKARRFISTRTPPLA